MATIEQMQQALIAADKAGDTQAATAIARALKQAQAQSTHGAPSQPAGAPVPQGLSGINEGIANVAGYPVDAVNSGLGGAFGWAGFKPSPEPVLGSDYWKHVMGTPVPGTNSSMIEPPTGNPTDAAVRRVGQGVGEAAASAPLAVAGAARPLASLAWTALSGLGSGAGGAAGHAIAPNNPWADSIGSLLGGGVPLSLGAAATHSAAVRDVIESAPTVSELKTAAGAKYDLAAQNGVTATPQQTTDLSDQLHAIVAGDRSATLPDGTLNAQYANVAHALGTFDQYAGQPLGAEYFKAVRQVLQDAASSSVKAERRVGSQMLAAYDKFTGGLAPELNEGNALYTRASRGKDLETLNVLAAAKANRTGQSIGEALVGKYGGLQDKIIAGKMNGYGSALEDAVTNVAEGSPARRVLMNVGKGAPRNPFTWTTTAGVPASLGWAVGGPVGAAAAGTGATLGAYGARGLANASTQRSAELAAAMARNGGALPSAAPSARNLMLAWLLAHGNEQQQQRP